MTARPYALALGVCPRGLGKPIPLWVKSRRGVNIRFGWESDISVRGNPLNTGLLSWLISESSNQGASLWACGISPSQRRLPRHS